MKLKNKVALVTGAGRGIGEAIALVFAREGADIAVNDIELSTAQETAEAVRKTGRKAITVIADVTRPDEVEKMVEKTVNELGGINILVNNAGIAYPRNAALEEKDMEVWDRVIEVNLRGTYLCSKTAGQWMAKAGSGKIINMSSVAGLSGFSMHGAYGPSKAGVVNLTKYLAVEWAGHRINVNCIAPGYTRTPLVELGISLGHFTEEDIVQRTPFRRLAEPEEIAKAALFLASDDASFITGETLAVDGGFLAFGV